MSQLAQKLAAYEEHFKSHQHQVNRFFLMAEKAFNTEFFPSSTVTREGDSAGHLAALGMRYEMDFRFVVLDAGPTTLLEVSLPATVHTPKERLALWYVDRLGNVRPALDNGFHPDSIDDRSFLLEILDTAQRAYFALVKKALPKVAD